MTDLINAPQINLGEVTPPAQLNPETAALLKRHGFDRLPTAEELEEYRVRRQQEVRDEVLFQADRRSWCDDGTRKVCANLRLARPGPREQRTIKATVTVDVEITLNTWTNKGALALAVEAGMLPVVGRMYNGTRVQSATVANLTVNDTPFELDEGLRKELTIDGNE